MPLKVEKKYFSYQIFPEKNRYTEQLIFNSVDDFRDFLGLNECDPKAKEIIDSYEKKFQVSSCNFTILEQKAL